MKKSERLIWAVMIFLTDFVVFAFPLAAVIVAYVLIARPSWFKKWVDFIYENESTDRG